MTNIPEISLRGLLVSGGFLAASVGVLYLSSRFRRLAVPSSSFFSFIGLFGMVTPPGSGSDDDKDDPGYEERMKDFEKVRPQLVQQLNEIADAYNEVQEENRTRRMLIGLGQEVADLAQRMEELEPIWRAMTPNYDVPPLLRSQSCDTYIFNYRRPARQQSLDARPRSYSSSEVQLSSHVQTNSTSAGVQSSSEVQLSSSSVDPQSSSSSAYPQSSSEVQLSSMSADVRSSSTSSSSSTESTSTESKQS